MRKRESEQPLGRQGVVFVMYTGRGIMLTKDVYHIQVKNRKKVFIGLLRFCIEYFYEFKRKGR